MRYAVYGSDRVTVAVMQRHMPSVEQAQVQSMRYNLAHET